ncbi:zinc ABC transporter substrate-binding protein [bacterium]|nr:zinc ABC transporter substrate-binding protein [bacterium]
MQSAKHIKIIIALIASVLICCAKNDSSQRLRIGVSLYPVYDIVTRIAGPGVDVVCLMPPGANPHTYSPRPSDMRLLENIDLFIGISPSFDGWAARLLTEKTVRLYLGNAEEADQLHDHTHNHSHTHADDNPHIWLSIHGAEKIVSQVEAAFVRLQPKGMASMINKPGRDRFLADLDSMNHVFKDQFQHIENKAFFQWHPAWDYLAADYNLDIAGTLEEGHGDTPSVRRMTDFVKLAKKRSIRTIVVGLNVDAKAAEALAREIKGELIRLDTMGHPDVPERSTYIKLMAYNAQKLALALMAQ